MMKSFFKKLAFVMALAMVVSLAAPAATTASAASNLKIAYQNGSAISEVNIAKVGGTEDLKFTGAPSNWKTLGVKWSSNNEAVATVDAAGVVTAMGAGTAVIAVQVGADQATVKVNVVDLPVYTATMGTTDNRNMTELTLDKVGAEFDLAFFGIKDYDKNRYNCNWYSVDENVATVDQKGLVKATGEGKTVISLGVYNVVTGKKHVVDSCTVVVGAAEPTKAPANKDAFTVAQKDTDKFVLTFEEAKTVDQIKENLTISVKLGDQDFPISFENVTVEGNTASVVTYARFENDEVYTLTYGKEVVEHKIVLGEIEKVGVNYYTGKNTENKVAYVTEEEENDYVTLLPALYDKYGNDITAKYDLNNFTFSYEVSSNVAPTCLYNDTYIFGAAGTATVTVTVDWVTDAGDFKTVTGKDSIPVLKRGNIGMKLVKAGIAATDATKSTDDINDTNRVNDNLFTYYTTPAESFQKDPNSALWNIASNSVMYKTTEDRNFIYTAVFEDNRGNVVTTNDFYKFGTFTYESTNSDVLTVADGGIVDVRETGRTNILVYFEPADGTENKKLVASTQVTVTPETYPVSFKMTTAVATVASHVVDEGLNDGTFKVQFLDQNGKPYRNDELMEYFKVEARDADTTINQVMQNTWDNGGYLYVWEDWSKNYVLKLDASVYKSDFVGKDAFNSKTYSFKFSLEESDLTEKIKTTYAPFSLVVKNTEEEYNLVKEFMKATANGKVDGVTSILNLDLSKITDEEERAYFKNIQNKIKNYKFNVAFGGNQNVDIAVKNVVGYEDKGAAGLIKSAWNTEISATYLSSAGLQIANVPSYLLQDAGAAKIKTGHVGYVYYKVNAPSKTVVAGKSVDNDFYSYGTSGNKVVFSFNDAVIDGKYMFKLNGTEIEAKVDTTDNGASAEVDPLYWVGKGNFYIQVGEEMKAIYTADGGYGGANPGNVKDKEGTNFYYTMYENGANVWYPVEFVKQEIISTEFNYAGSGSYTTTFYNTRKEGTSLQSLATRTISISNSQSEVKYLGLNPEYAGVTELEITRNNLEAIVEEQLRFSYEDLFIGDYYENNGYGMSVKLRTEVPEDPTADPQPKVKFDSNGKSVNITDLYFDVTVDDGSGEYTYTSVVKVNARIKAK